MKTSFKNRHILSIADFSRSDLDCILKRASAIKQGRYLRHCKGKIMASCFFEPSTRTRLSFESAMYRQGGQVIGFSDISSTSIQKGESLEDTLRVVSGFADIIVFRHSQSGISKQMSDIVRVPLINAGDGSNEHPTQTLLDLFTIKEAFGSVDNLKIAFVGDLKYGRAVHSLVLGLKHYSPTLYFVAPDDAQMPIFIQNALKNASIPFFSANQIEEIVDQVDIIYMTRIQKERFEDLATYEKIKDSYRLTLSHFKGRKESLRIMHPLPRLQEIDREIDETPFALYFEQAKNGLYVREALFSLIL